MGLKAARFVSIVTAGLAAGIALCHVMELPNKLAMPGPAWLFVQKMLYRGFYGYTGTLELVALISVIYLAVLVRRRHGIFVLSVAAVAAVTAAWVVWLAVVNPVEVELTDDIALPLAWQELRMRWELAQAARAALFFSALLLLVGGTLADTKEPGTSAQL